MPATALTSICAVAVWLAANLVAAQSQCTPPCTSGQACQQVFNSNNQYTCVVSSSPPPAAALTAHAGPVPSVAPAPAGCQSCSATQTCQQVFNSNQYHCVGAPIASAAAPIALTGRPVGCESCSSTQTCQQVYNSNQYHCINRTVVATVPGPAPSTASSNNSTSISNNSACNNECSEDESCQQVYNSRQYACRLKQSSLSPAAPAVGSDSPITASAPTSPTASDSSVSARDNSANLSGGAIFGIVLAALIFVTMVALAGVISYSKWKSSYVRYQSEPEPPKFVSGI